MIVCWSTTESWATSCVCHVVSSCVKTGHFYTSTKCYLYVAYVYTETSTLVWPNDLQSSSEPFSSEDKAEPGRQQTEDALTGISHSHSSPQGSGVNVRAMTRVKFTAAHESEVRHKNRLNDNLTSRECKRHSLSRPLASHSHSGTPSHSWGKTVTLCPAKWTYNTVSDYSLLCHLSCFS